jgi:hypothetical protein
VGKKVRGLSSLCEETKRCCTSRRSKVTTLARGLHKKLKLLSLKAMRKERTDHYQSAAEDERGNLYYYIVKQ